MKAATLEHLNVTVTDPVATADLFCRLFDWKIRWQGDAIDGGHSIHVGASDSYVALYTKGKPVSPGLESYVQLLGLNHIGIVVEDIDAVEARVTGAGFTPHSHGDYEPGKRFYFKDHDGLEIEVVSYS